QLLIPLLHRPAALPQTYRLHSARPFGEVREGILDLAVGLLLDQQPDRFRPGAVPGLPALSGPDPQPGEPTRQLPLRPLAPRYTTPAHALGQVAQGDGLGAVVGQPRSRRGPAAPRRGRLLPTRRLREDDEVTGHADDIAQPAGGQAVAEVDRDAVAGIGHDGPAGQTLAPDPVQQFQGDRGLGEWPALALGHTGAVEAFLVGQPAVRQVQAQVQRVMALGADVMHRDGDLAVGLLAQGTTVLALDADGVLTLFGERDIVKEEDALGTGEGRGEVGAVAAEDLLLIPGALVDELLEGLLGVLAGQPLGQGDTAGERLDTFAFAVEQESLEINAGPAGGLGLREILSEEGGVVTETLEHSGREFGSVG